MITAHMIIKNEDRWVWYAIQSVLPLVDRFLITDTGSTDKTVEIIRSIKNKKIEFDIHKINSAKEVTNIRQNHIDKTKSGWIWLVDGDEIYPERLSREIVNKTKSNLVGILTRRFDLLGDVYHRQSESVGSYELLGYMGHASTRLVNKDRVKGLAFHGDYPLEGYYDEKMKSLKDYPQKNFYLTKHKYWHAGYLIRSSNGGNLASTINRNKYKIERGIRISEPLPEIFSKQPSKKSLNPLKQRGLVYEILAFVITPIKNLKRKLL